MPILPFFLFVCRNALAPMFALSLVMIVFYLLGTQRFFGLGILGAVLGVQMTVALLLYAFDFVEPLDILTWGYPIALTIAWLLDKRISARRAKRADDDQPEPPLQGQWYEEVPNEVHEG